MDKTNATIILISIAIGALFAWLMDYTEWWQWLLSIVVTCIIAYGLFLLFLIALTIAGYFVMRKYWRENKKEIKFKLRFFWEKLWRPFETIEEIEEEVRRQYDETTE